MNDTNTGGAAFPHENHHGHKVTGMTLRDYFAAKAMQVVLYQCDCFPDEDWRMGVALDSYKMADAMIAARSQP